MKKGTRIMALVLLVLMISSILCTNAFAAVAGIVSTSPSTITVKTSSKWFTSASVTLKFKQGYGPNDIGNTVYAYGIWSVAVYDASGNKVKSVPCWNTSSVTIGGLKRNTTYTIKVTADKTSNLGGYRVKNWTREPGWYVHSTKNVVTYK